MTFGYGFSYGVTAFCKPTFKLFAEHLIKNMEKYDDSLTNIEKYDDPLTKV